MNMQRDAEMLFELSICLGLVAALQAPQHSEVQ